MKLKTLDIAQPSCAKLTAQIVAGRLPYPAWLATLRELAALVKLSPWLIGDLLNAGHAAYGEKYIAAMDLFDLEKGTLANICWVCKTFEPSRRHENLSFAHHQEIAAFTDDPNEQNKLLARAANQRWTRSQLRIAMRRAAATELEPPTGRVNFVPQIWFLEGRKWYQDQIDACPPPDRRAALAAELRHTINELQNLLQKLDA